jgi:ligand-binding sensor domain-containing protein/signal transduction histidine kinase
MILANSKGTGERSGRWLAAALLLAGSLSGAALEPSTPLANYGRQAWVMENGLPQNTVQTLLQGRQGFVWLGTEVGLVRFDGSGFAVFDTNSSPPLPGNDIRCLLETRDGALWVGTSEGLARWKDGTVTAFTAANGLPGGSARALVETANGGLWVWTDMGLARLDGNRFTAFSSEDGVPGGAIASVAADAQGGLWVATSQGAAVYRDGRWAPARPSGTASLQRSGGDGPYRVVAVSDGSILLASGEGVFQRAAGRWTLLAPPEAMPSDGVDFLLLLPGGELALASKSTLVIMRGGRAIQRLTAGHEIPGSRIQTLFADRAGSLWIGTNNGLARLEAGNLQVLPVTDPLGSASVLALMEDREGNLWAGTETDGLHILRDQRFRTIGAREGLSFDATTAVVEDLAGTLWVGTSGGGLDALGRGGTGAIRNYTVRNGLLSDVILSLAAAPNGDLWVGTPDGLNRIRGGSITSYTSADGLPDDFIRSLLADADGSLWIGTRRGLTHWTQGRGGMHLETYTQANGLGSDLVGAMARDSNGDLWVATFAGLSRIRNGKIVNYTTANGLSSNVVTALLPRAGGTMLIGTQDHGWDFWDGQHFSAGTHGGLSQTTIRAILEDGSGHLWFATAIGIARCDCDGAGGCSHWIEFGAADGLRSREMATNSHPSAWRSRDGHLWFATPKGLVEVDPAHFPINTVPPPVALERFAVDDVSQALHTAGFVMQIPAGHVHFQFDYAGLSFTAPQKVRYRYMLEGFDHGWTEAGARRTAYYTNIPPGRYTFRVQAANNDGLWNTEGAALTFELRPLFYQTAWFYVLLLLAAAGLVLWLLRRRLRLAESEFRAVLGERNRIAREIHDTLAQGYVGISVQLEVLAELLRQHKVEAAARHLDLTRGNVREGLADARQSIWALRSQDSGETTLPVRVRRIVEGAGGHGFESSFSIYGAYRPLPPGTEREILRVAQEAIHNVKKHAGARNLSVQLEYGPAEIALEVRDDGSGFAVGEELESPPGHYGLTGMRERAAAIGGTLEVTSEAGEGTAVRLRAPAPREHKEATGEPK